MSTTAHDLVFAGMAAESYERHFVPAIGRPVATRLVEGARLRPGERVLDVACGTGIVTRLAVERVGPEGSVAGLDPNPGMLAVARKAAGRTGVTWHEAAAENMPLSDRSFDVALCGQGLQFFRDRPAALRETRRVLVPGGRFLANVAGPAPPPFRVMADAFARHVGPEGAAFVRLVFSLHDIDELRRLAEAAGFDRVEVQTERIPLEFGPPAAFLWRYVESTPLAAAAAKLGPAGRMALEREFEEACAPMLDRGLLKGEARVATVRATNPAVRL